MIGRSLGHYRITAAIGAGGMGEVYRATDTKLGRDVAIKMLPAAVAQDPERLARFEREARSLASLNHPNIVTIYAVEEDGGSRFLAMELVEGETLDTLLAPGGLPLPRFFEIAVPLADALSAAHERGIVHRDLKPGNVMVTREGRVKVLDFGLAKLEAADSNPNLTSTPTESRNLTSEGQVFGTVAYMSPEQARGGKVDARSDVFSLGVVLYQMLTGERPFQGASAVDMISSILRDTPPSVTDRRGDLPPHLARIVRRCLEKDPRDRYQTSRDVHNELRDLRNETSAAPSAASPRSETAPGGIVAEKTVPPARTARKWPVFVAIALVLLGIALYAAKRSGTFQTASRAAQTGTEPHPIQSIAVLPLDNYSGDPGQDYFAEGMTDELTSDLANISQLRVISRGSVMQFKGAHRPPTPEIARILNVDAIVEGSVLRSGDKVRITAQLIDARSDRHLWSKSFERNSRDVLALQDELASAIAREIHVRLTPAEQSRLTRAASVNPEAYDAYLKGRYFFNRPSDENLSKAIAQFEEAIKLDPNFAPAFSGLSDAYLWAGLQRRRTHRLGSGAPGEGRSGKGDPAGRRFRRSAYLPGGIQDLVRARLGGIRERISPGIRAQSELCIRARSVRSGACVRGPARRIGGREQARNGARPAVSANPHRRSHRVCLARQIRGGQGALPEGCESRPDLLLCSIHGWVDPHSGRETPRRDSALPEGQGARVTSVRGRVARVRVWGYGRSKGRARCDRGAEQILAEGLRAPVQPRDRVSRSGRSRARPRLSRTSIRGGFAMDDLPSGRPDLQSPPLGAPIRGADAQARVREVKPATKGGKSMIGMTARIGGSRNALLAMGVLTLTLGCSTMAAPRQSTLQQQTGEGSMSATALRMRVYETAGRLGGALESAADEIRSKSSDPAVRRRALLWKADGIPTIYAAAFQPDPLAGGLDLWVLIVQMDLYFTDGAGKAAFGAQQPIAVAAVRQMRASGEEAAALVSASPEQFARRRANVEEFARAHPIEGSFSARATAAGELARFFDQQERGALAVVGQAGDTLEDLSLRLGSYSTLLPKEVRWQGELLAADLGGRDSLRSTLEDLDDIGKAARRADAVLADLPGTVRTATGPVGELLDKQRSALMAAIEQQRISLSAYATSERQAIADAILQEHKAAFESIGQERAAALREVDAISKRSLDEATRRARSVVDYVFWRVLILLAVAGIIVVVAYRLGRGPRPATADK